MRTLATLVPFVLPVLQLPAQSLLHSYSLPPGVDCQLLRPAGDTNGDGKPDFVAITKQYLPTTVVLSVVIVSGATGAPLHTLTDPVLQNEREVVGIGDVNGDNRSDVLLVTAQLLRVYSGASGQVLASLPISPSNLSALTGCGIGDYNGNGTADVAIAINDSSSGNTTLRLLRGENLSLLTNLATFQGGDDPTIRAVGDITGDGKMEIAYCRATGSVDVVNGSSGAVLWSLAPGGNDGGRRIDALDLDGDGKRELFFFRPELNGPGFHGMFSVHEAVTGAQRFARQSPIGNGYGTTVAGLGDLDLDGTQDYAQLFYGNGTPTVLASSGANGRRLWALPSWPPLLSLWWWLAPVGDVDGDSFGDFAVLSDGQVSDGFHVISGRVLAESQPQAGACGGGPFFPLLGATRPILGQVMTIAGQYGPTAAGLLAFSLQPAAPTWLGASTCYAYIDLGNAIVLAGITQPQWSLPVPIPLLPQGAGIEIALQAVFLPTSGPLGFDLSNGVWGRLGYQ